MRSRIREKDVNLEEEMQNKRKRRKVRGREVE